MLRGAEEVIYESMESGTFLQKEVLETATRVRMSTCTPGLALHRLYLVGGHFHSYTPASLSLHPAPPCLSSAGLTGGIIVSCDSLVARA